jgi:hypothetical protein
VELGSPLPSRSTLRLQPTPHISFYLWQRDQQGVAF